MAEEWNLAETLSFVHTNHFLQVLFLHIVVFP